MHLLLYYHTIPIITTYIRTLYNTDYFITLKKFNSAISLKLIDKNANLI